MNLAHIDSFAEMLISKLQFLENGENGDREKLRPTSKWKYKDVGDKDTK